MINVITKTNCGICGKQLCSRHVVSGNSCRLVSFTCNVSGYSSLFVRTFGSIIPFMLGSFMSLVVVGFLCYLALVAKW